MSILADAQTAITTLVKKRRNEKVHGKGVTCSDKHRTLDNDERKKLKDTDEIIEGTLSITKEDLGPLLDKRIGAPNCPCGNGVFSVASEDNEFPSILKMADVREEGAEQWFYWLVCGGCFQVKFVSAAACWQELRKGESSN